MSSSLILKPTSLYTHCSRSSLFALSTNSRVSISSVSFPRYFTTRRRLSLGIRALNNSSSDSNTNDTDIGNSQPKNRKDILLEYVKNVQPEIMELFVKRASPQVVEAMRQTVTNMIGSLPPQFFSVTVTTVAENLAQLMYSVMMTGYMFRNAQFRIELQQSLEQVALPEPQENKDAPDYAPGTQKKVSGEVIRWNNVSGPERIDAEKYIELLEAELEELNRQVARKSTNGQNELLEYMKSLEPQNLRKLKMAAKEAGALKEAKNRLEKEVEELTSRLQLEKRMRDDLEQLKNQENEKLQQALEIMEKQFQETKTLLMKECEEAVKKAADQVPIIQEVPVYDDELMSKLTVENEQLKECVSSLEKKIDETEKKYEKISKLNQESVSNNELIDKLSAENEHLQRLVISLETKINETERKYAETSKQSEDPVFDNESINRLAVENKQLEEMVSSLENKIDETQKKYEETSKLTEELEGVVSSLEQKIDETQKKYEETRKLSEERLKQSQEAESKMIGLKIAVHRLEEKIAYMETERKSKFSDYPSFSNGHVNEPNKDLPSGTPKKVFGTESMRKSHMERQRELADSLIKCVAGDAGFSQGKPVAAVTMYKCLLHWKTFEAERTNVFDRLTELISSAFQNSDNNSHLAYWLSNTTTLLFLLQRSFKANKDWKPPQPPTFFGRMAQGFRASPSSANLQIDIVRPVEAKQPALLFKQQLTAYVEMFFAIIRDNFKTELSPVLSGSRQVPKTSEIAEDPLVHHWQDVIDCLDSFLNTLKENHVPKVYVQKIFIQIFSYINVQLFNSVLLNRECCTFSNGEYVKDGLDKLEAWCGEATDEFTGSSWDELKHIRQAVGFLVINHKGRISFEDLTSDLCPLLSVKQLYKICTTYWDDDYNTTSVSPDVILSMKTSMPGENEGEMDSDKGCSLHDNSSIPLPVDDLSPSPDERDFAGVKPPPLLLENPDFQFLQE